MTSHVNVKVFILSSFTLLKEKKTLPPQLDGCNCFLFFCQCCSPVFSSQPVWIDHCRMSDLVKVSVKCLFFGFYCCSCFFPVPCWNKIAPVCDEGQVKIQGSLRSLLDTSAKFSSPLLYLLLRQLDLLKTIMRRHGALLKEQSIIFWSGTGYAGIYFKQPDGPTNSCWQSCLGGGLHDWVTFYYNIAKTTHLMVDYEFCPKAAVVGVGAKTFVLKGHIWRFCKGGGGIFFLICTFYFLK